MKKSFVVLFVFAFFLMLSSPSNADLTEGLVAYFPFNGNANDHSGNGLDATVYGATLTEDRLGNPDSAYYFDGVNSNVMHLPADQVRALLNGASAFTAAVWVYNDGPGDNYRNVLRICDTGGDSRGLMFRIGSCCAVSDPGYNKLEVLLGTVGTQTQHIGSATEIPVGTWTHLAIVYDGSKIWLFIDGIAPDVVYRNRSEVPNGVPRTGAVTMGDSVAYISAYNTENFHGDIDEVRMYDRALSSAEILDLFEHDDQNIMWTVTPPAEASEVYGYETAHNSNLLNVISILFFPIGAVIFLRILSRRK